MAVDTEYILYRGTSGDVNPAELMKYLYSYY